MQRSRIDQKAIKEIGKIAAARVVQNPDDLTIMTSNGVTLRLKVKDVKQSGRATKGVHLIKPGEGDGVAAFDGVHRQVGVRGKGALRKIGSQVHGPRNEELGAIGPAAP